MSKPRLNFFISITEASGVALLQSIYAASIFVSLTLRACITQIVLLTSEDVGTAGTSPGRPGYFLLDHEHDTLHCAQLPLSSFSAVMAAHVNMSRVT